MKDLSSVLFLGFDGTCQNLEEARKSLSALPQLDHVFLLLLASWVTFTSLSVLWKPLAGTVPRLAYTSLEIHSCQNPLWYRKGAGNLILLPLISPFCSVFVSTRARAFLLGVTEGLSPYHIPGSQAFYSHLFAGAHVLFAGPDQRYHKYIGTTEVTSACQNQVPHFTGQISWNPFLFTSVNSEEGVPWEFAPWGFCHLPLCFGLDKGILGSESDPASLLSFTKKWYYF